MALCPKLSQSLSALRALRPVFVGLSLLLSLEASWAQPTATREPPNTLDTFSGVARIVAVGDLHGDYERFVAVLKLCRITDDRLSWSGGKTHFVQTGDVLDRGPDSKKILDLLMQLEQQAEKSGGKVHALIGNHEYMTMMGDLRYVSDGELAAFGDGPRQTPVGREPACSVARYRAAFSRAGKYGAWIVSHNAIVKLNRTLFMHGGLSARYVNRKLSELNSAIRGELRQPVPGAFSVGADPEGPLWFRGLAQSHQPSVIAAFLQDMKTAQGSDRIVMGHTIQDQGISVQQGGKIVLIDVGLSRWTLGGTPSCLVIERNGADDRLSILRDSAPLSQGTKPL